MTSLGDEYTPAEARINRIFDRADKRIRSIIMAAADDAVKGVTEQLKKVAAEVDAEVQAGKESSVSSETLDGLKSAVQALDDRNPDAPEA